MSVRFLDAFGYASAASHTPNNAGDDLRANWYGAAAYTITELANSAEGRRCYLSGTAGGILPLFNKPAPGVSEILVGCRFYLADLTTSRLICKFTDRAGVVFGALGFNGATNKLVYVISAGSDPTSGIVLSSTPELAVGWQYIEIQLVAHDTTGEVHFQIGGSAAGSVTGADTVLSGTVGDPIDVVFCPDETVGDWNAADRLTDIYIADFDDGFYGNTEVWYQRCDAAGASADFTPSAGLNHQNVDDEGSDGDTTYNQSATPGDRDSFTHTDVQTAAPHAVQVLAAVRAVGTPYARAAIGIRSGAVDSEYGPLEIVDAYDVIRGPVVEVDPDGGAPWDAAGLNTAQTYIEVQA